ncbi:MAG: hypothetical protein ABWK53_06175 [Anaerolineales bacterium]
MTQSIIRRLAAGKNPDDIIYELCHTHHLTWPEAEALVQQIQAEHEETIIKKQSPLMIALALILFVLGLGATAVGLYTLLGAFAVYTEAGGPSNALGFLSYALHYWPSAAAIVVFGFSAIVGSLIGMRQTLGALLDGLFDRLGL